MKASISLDKRAFDDKSLVDNYDEVVAEYKKYHSIAAQGKRLEDVLTKEELAKLREDEDLVDALETRSDQGESNILADHQQAAEPQLAANGDAVMEQAQTGAEEPASPENQESSTAAAGEGPRHEGGAATGMPQALLGTVQDENVKNMIMSWYYAGYYTGLHSGKQQGNVQKGV
ncbi:hypothetical protein EJ04DRAFT_168824 [Polyplosphaeria fusca]|uniref:Survival motor neuron Tudor domain-containing protein n=1 Tax=Polyplosphaeria fusca TaxID=682080 RepID=A0A9P4V8Q9_9PLEO|nr:hypothetical protein EJ04DRAFT_168824 [Polyplosphaeria fusca]